MEDSLSVTRTTYRVSDFLSWQRQGSLDLRPPFQRGNVWSPKAKSFFIDTILRGFPVPVVLIQDKTDPKTFEPTRLVVDGQQRIRTVLAYVDLRCLKPVEEADAFDILRVHNREIAGASFRELNRDLQQRILTFEFSVHVLPSTTPDRTILETFARMNSTGTRLNEQELRNAEFNGSFKQLAYRLAYEHLERWLEWGVFTKAQVARMKEVELTSELLMYLANGFSGKSQAAIRRAYKDWDDEVPSERHLQRRFGHLMDILDAAYSTAPDQPSFRNSPFNTQGWFYPLYVFIHSLVYSESISENPAERPKKVKAEALRNHLDRRAEVLRSADIDDDLLKALRGAATDRSSRQTRFEFLAQGWRGA